MSTSSVILQNKRKKGSVLNLVIVLNYLLLSSGAFSQYRHWRVVSRFLVSFPCGHESIAHTTPRQFFIQCGGSERLWISTGSGKTNTGIKLVYLFCKINRQLEAEGKGKKTVLYCGPSNKSVDLVASECPCCPNCHVEKGLATTMSSCVFSNSMMSSFSAQATS